MNRRFRATCLLLLAALVALSLGQSAQASTVTLPHQVNTVPSTATPNVNNGAVLAVTQVGSRIIIGGSFTSAGQQGSTASVTRNRILAFNSSTGTIDTGFAPNLNGTVENLAPGPTADTVYAAGAFGTVNGSTAKGVVLLSTVTGAIVSGFAPAPLNGVVFGVRLSPDHAHLYIGGSFTKVGGQTRQGLASLNPSTGKEDGFLAVQTTGHHNYTGQNGQSNGSVGPRKIDVSPDGKTMIAIGNFKYADGVLHDQIVRIDLTGATAQVDTAWNTAAYSATCFSGAYDTYMSDVDFAPDSSYFVVGATGGSGTNTDGTNSSCDSAARFETSSSGADVRPTWLDYTGQDTIGSVAVAGDAIYTGGHNRWLNNENGYDNPGQGAVPRPGLSALDPINGIPLAWNPGRNPRGVGAYALLVTSNGLYVGSDTNYIGNHKYLRKRIAFFPLAGGADLASTSTDSLPANVYRTGQIPTSNNTNVLYRVDAGGPAIGATDNGPDWLADQSDSDDGAAYRNTGSNSAGYDQVGSVNSSVPSTTPSAIFNSERWSPSDTPPLTYNFPVPANTAIEVRLFFANRYPGTSQPGQRVFDVDINGQQVLTNYDIAADAGDNTGTMKAFDYTSVSNGVSIDLTHVTENPLINGIEIVRTGSSTTTGNLNTLSSKYFTGTAPAGADTSVSTTGTDWSQVRGAFRVGNQLFYGQADGTFHERSFDGKTFGTPVTVDPYNDPVWSNVNTGSGGTYRGTVPDLYGQFSSVTGMFYSAGKLFYTMTGSSTLYARYFSPDSGIIGAHVFTYNGVFASTAGMFFSNGSIYWAAKSTGDLHRVSFDGSTVGSDDTVVDGPSTGGTDWRARGLFLAARGAGNQAPVARATVSCQQLSCTFNGAGSSDADGSVTGYSWNFGDGSQPATGASVQHSYAAAGTYTASLTVTDNDGATGNTTATAKPTTSAPAAISYLGGDQVAGNAQTETVTVPLSVSSGDGLVLLASSSTSTTPDSPAGWTLVKSVINSSMTTTVWQRVATATDAGADVSVARVGFHKATLQVLAYRGTDVGTPVSAAQVATDSGGTSHATPTVSGITDGSWALSYWTDKNGAENSWTTPAGVTVRSTATGSGSGQVTSVVADAGPVSGSYGGQTATSSVAVAKSEQWTIVLTPAS